MKHATRLLTVLLMAALLTGCGETPIPSGTDPNPLSPDPEISVQPGNLLENASPETSALLLYYYDGETVTVRHLFDQEREKEIISEINALSSVDRAEEGMLEHWELPSYGLWISDKEGWDISVAWSNGLWLDQQGNVYQVEVDFPGYWEKLEGEMEESGLSVYYFPNSEYLAPYDSRFLAEAEDPYAIMDMPLGVTMELVSMEENIATLIIDNHSGEEFSYSMYYALQRKIDDTWYEMVPEDNVAFNDVAVILPDMEQAEITCDLSIFGDLEPGTYRIVKDGMIAVFALEENGICSYPLRQE